MRSIPSRAEPLLRTALARPIIMGRLTPQEWDLLLRQARASALMSRIANLIDEHGLREAVPAEAWRHLDGERRFAARLAHDVQIEIGRIAEPLLRAGIEVVLLKGAAYIVGDLPPAQGRDFSDIDIMVPRADIETAELSLRLEGWRSKELDRWDERFYRAWMHELPPLVHAVRDSVVDLHHTIVPLMAAIRPDARLLFEAARPGTTDPSVKVLGPPDMVLHSATHLFNEGEFGRALRDLVDLDLLFRHFGRDAGFWSAFLARAARLNLGRPAYYALRCTVRFLGTPIPAHTISGCRCGS
jgi:hypothetical protein